MISEVLKSNSTLKTLDVSCEGEYINERQQELNRIE